MAARRVKGAQCTKCALRLDEAPARCPSCGAIASFVASLHSAPQRVTPESPWGREDVVGGFPGGMPGGEVAGGFGDFAQGGVEEQIAAPEPAFPRASGARTKKKQIKLAVRDMDDVKPTDFVQLPSGHAIFDQMTDGGPCIGTTSGLTAFPGVGKSTLLLEVAYHYRARGRRVTILALEEPSGDVRARARRCNLPDRFPAGKRKNGKSLGWVQIISPLDEVEGETREEREERMEKGFNLALLVELVDPATEVLILDSVSRCHNPEVGDKNGSPLQLKHAGHIFYERCHGVGHFAGSKPIVGISILQSTKEGDSAVPQAFTHTVDATYIGEHVTRDGHVVVAAADQKKPTGYVGFRSHGKNRNGSTLADAYARMTPRGLVHIDEEEVQVSLKHEEAMQKAAKSIKDRREPLSLAGT